MKKVFLDMDGTLAKFYEHADCLERMYLPKFFKTLGRYVNIIGALRKLPKISDGDIEFYALSAVNAAVKEQAVAEKQEWLKKHCPFIPESNYIFMLVGEDKAEKAKEICSIIDGDCFLIDDYNQNLEDWANAGGTPIKFVNEINDKGNLGPLWAGERIRYDFSVTRLTEELKRILQL